MLGKAIYFISTIFLILCCCVGAILAGFLLEAFLVRVLKNRGGKWLGHEGISNPTTMSNWSAYYL